MSAAATTPGRKGKTKPVGFTRRVPTYSRINLACLTPREGTLLTSTDGSLVTSERYFHNGRHRFLNATGTFIALQLLEVIAW
jgi:hypothetical protein